MDVLPSGLMTHTSHVAALIPNTGLMTMRVLVNELDALFGYVDPPISRSVMLAPDTKLEPLMVKGCELFDPVAGLGLTLEILGDGDDPL